MAQIKEFPRGDASKEVMMEVVTAVVAPWTCKVMIFFLWSEEEEEKRNGVMREMQGKWQSAGF